MSFRTPCLLFVLGLLAACGGDDSSAPVNTGAVEGTDAGVGDAAADDESDEDEDVPCTPAYPAYQAGMTVKSGALTVRLVSATPAPPRQKVKNDWLLEITNADQSAAAGATLSNPSSYMPIHRHYGPTNPIVVPSSTPGQATLSTINFHMRGPWQVNFDVTLPGQKPSPATIQVCVQ